MRASALIPTVGAILVRPSLWGVALRVTWRHRPERWWRGPQAFREIQPWLRFRMETAFGDPGHIPSSAEALEFLRWVQSTESSIGRDARRW